jgi:hypothetical protein
MLRKVFSGQPLKKVFEEDPALAEKQREKVNAILRAQ